MFDVNKLRLLDYKLKELRFKFVSVDAAGYKTGKMMMIDR
jgi:PP-loop superfamily ATP-utilizing enzyme